MEKTNDTLLLFEVGQARMGLSLSQVDRLEEFSLSKVEKSGDKDVVQYRDQIMPLVHLSHIFSQGLSTPDEEKKTVKVVVTSSGDKKVGLVVDQILDIVEETVDIQKGGKQAGLLGSAMVQNRVTDLMDVKEVLQMMTPNL